MDALENSVCIVTGAGSGLGESAAIELGSYGATVVLNDLGVSLEGKNPDRQPLAKTAKAVEEAGGTSITSFGDVTDLTYTEELVETAVEKGGGVDFVINFAGIQRDGLIHEMTEEEWDSVLDVHLKGHFGTLRAVTRYWRSIYDDSEGFSRPKSYVAISSGRARGGAGQLNYSAAKAGILGLMRTAARELAEFDIRVNALMPAAETRMTKQASDGYEYSGEIDFEQLPPERVSAMVAFLASSRVEDITGCTIGIGGEGMIYVTDPEFVRTAYREGGWTTETIGEKFEQLTNGESTFKTGDGGVSDFLF